MASGYPDYFRVVQDLTGGYGAKVDETGYLWVFALDGAGYGETQGVSVHGTEDLLPGTTGVADWVSSVDGRHGKYMFLQCSWDEPTVPMRVKLEDTTSGIEIMDQYFICSCQLNLGGFMVTGSDTIKISLYNNASFTRTVRFNIHFVRVPG